MCVMWTNCTWHGSLICRELSKESKVEITTQAPLTYLKQVNINRGRLNTNQEKWFKKREIKKERERDFNINERDRDVCLCIVYYHDKRALISDKKRERDKTSENQGHSNRSGLNNLLTLVKQINNNSDGEDFASMVYLKVMVGNNYMKTCKLSSCNYCFGLSPCLGSIYTY